MSWKFGNQVIQWLMDEGKRVDPNQPDREVYENGVEAGATQCVFFGFEDEDDAGNARVFKAHADNGKGMDRLQHLAYLSTLMNSGTTVATTTALGAPKNKGVGARIASLARNPEGVDFYSRTAAETKAGVPWHLVRLLPTGPKEVWDDGNGGTVNDEIVDADKEEVKQIEAFCKSGHGTVVVFRGDGSDDTWTEDSWKRTFEYMQKRYLSFPVPLRIDGTTIKALKGRARVDYRYTVPALRSYYAKHTGVTSVLTLSDGTEIEWFVFDHTAAGNKFDAINRKTGKPYGVAMQTGPSRSNGFRGIALLDHNELFEHSAYRACFNLIGKAVSRVSLIITPPSGLLRQTTNRQHLEVVGGGEIPYDVWGKEFTENMPDPIKALMESDWQASDTITAADLDRLDPDWYKRIVAKPTFMVDEIGSDYIENLEPVVAREGGNGRGNGGGGGGGGSNPGNGNGNRAGNNHSADRQKGTKVRRSSVKGREESFTYLDLEAVWLPDTPDPTNPTQPTWTSVIPSSSDTDAVRDRGWAYYPGITSNRIYLRKSGDPFLKTQGKFCGLHPTAHTPKVVHDVEAAYSMEAIAKVVHVRDGVTTWTTSDIEDQFKGLHFSFALGGLNSVEETVKLLLRKTAAPPKAAKSKRLVKRSTP